MPLVVAAGLVLLVCCLVLPIVAFLRTERIRSLEARLEGVEAALLRLMRERSGAPPAPEPAPAPPPEPMPRPAVPPQISPMVAAPRQLETVIGQKWLGWIAVILIFFAAAFFLKYAFESRWIGETGRVVLGIVAGLAFLWAGFDRHRRGWHYFSQVLTAGGIVLLYLSIYAAYGYYRLIEPGSAFVFLALVVVGAHLLAFGYGSRPIAIMGLGGGFLVPVLLAGRRDAYAVLFSYIVALDAGVLSLVIARRWRWIATLAFLGSHGLFWTWHGEHYQLAKRPAALLFQAALFLLFVLADLAPQLRRRASGIEEWILAAANPFAFYATSYFLLRGDYPDWMGAFAAAMAVVHAGLAQAHSALQPADRRMKLILLGTAAAFVTAAIPVQWESNWITIAWAAEAAGLLWAGAETSSRALRVFSAIVFGLAVFRYLVEDVAWDRPVFTPVFNRYFLTTVILTACLGAAAYVSRRVGTGTVLAAGLAAAAIFWIGSSVEVYTYFEAEARAVARSAGPESFAAARQLRWTGQMALSVLWSAYAAALTAAGFRLRRSALRTAGLVLFGLTLIKVVSVDMAELRQLYRIVAVLALGVLLLAVAWAYQRMLRREQVDE